MDDSSFRDELRRLTEDVQRERAMRQFLEKSIESMRGQFGALQQSETYFRHLTEFALDLIAVLDPDGTIRFQSHSITEELGWEAPDYLGQNAFGFLHPEDEPTVREAFARALETHGPTPGLTFRFRHKDGSWRVLEGRGNNLMSDPAVRGIVFVSRDVTERKRLEAQFNQLAGGVAHDFNNILTAIVGYADIAQTRQNEDSRLSWALNEISKAADRAAGVTQQLLAFSCKQVLKPKVMNLVDVVAAMEPTLRSALSQEIQLFIINPSTGTFVRADRCQIEQVILNLALNARDAMPEGGTFTIDMRSGPEPADSMLPDGCFPSDFVTVSISDTGTGMSPDVKARIFEPYFTTKPDGKGAGLGLATCFGIIKQSGGAMSVESTLGKGTTFHLYLPKATIAESPVAPVSISSAPGGHETILFAEDEPALRELGETVLTEAGYEVFSAANGVEALRIVEEHPEVQFDLLLTDVVMPEMGGRELADKIQERMPSTRILFCSGYARDAIFHRGLEEDLFFLPKPYTVAELLKRVDEALEHHPAPRDPVAV